MISTFWVLNPNDRSKILITMSYLSMLLTLVRELSQKPRQNTDISSSASAVLKTQDDVFRSKHMGRWKRILPRALEWLAPALRKLQPTKARNNLSYNKGQFLLMFKTNIASRIKILFQVGSKVDWNFFSSRKTGWWGEWNQGEISLSLRLLLKHGEYLATPRELLPGKCSMTSIVVVVCASFQKSK